MINIALVVHFPLMNPHCTSAISCRIGLFILFVRTFSINFVMWLIRLIVLCSSHSVVPAFFGNRINIDLDRLLDYTIQIEGMDKTIYRVQYRNTKTCSWNVCERFLHTHEKLSFRKDYGKHVKAL